ncbi:MAG: hypothetical protein MUC50_02170 [Myxococcota bacterium]|nr:hypothetical protein [Myxococcota bacterium]
MTCSKVGTRKESFVRADTGAFIAKGSCGKNLRVVAHGKNCGGSIGYSCEYSHTCYGMPGDGIIGGTGKCLDTELGFCLNHADCARTMPNLAPPGYHACENHHCVRKVATAALGEMCGGFANMQCSEGLVCVDENGQPAPTGTCQFPRVAEGAICGGFANTQCVAGLECFNQAGQPAPTGTCQRGEGAVCGGRAGLRCAEGLFCAYEEETCVMPDHSGTCTQKIVGFNCSPPNPAIDNRVCDCNGNTQVDRCHAKVENVSIAHTGPCDQD